MDTEVKVSLTFLSPILVLAVDDEADMGMLTKEFLERAGNVTVNLAGSVKDARTALSQKRYDAIVSDYQMPEEDGIQFLKSLRASGDMIPFILFTGKGREEVVIEAINNGADAYLQKGGDPKSLFAELEHHIGKIMQRRKAETALLDSESEFRTLFENNPDPVVLVGLDGRVLNTNQAGARMVQMTKDEIIGETFTGLGVFSEEDIAHFRGTMKAIMQGEPVTPITSKVHRRDGTDRWVEMRSAIVRKVDHCDAFQIIARDITDRKREDQVLRQNNDDLQVTNQQLAAVEEELRKQLDTTLRSEDELRREKAFSETLMDSLQGIFYLYDAQTLRLVRWNRNYREVGGYTDEEMSGKHVLDWHRKEDADAVLATISNVMIRGQASIEASLIMKDGREVPYLLPGKRIDTRGRSFFLGVGVDISERLASENRERRLNRELVAIKECGRALIKADSEQSLLNEICRIVCEVAGYRLAWIGMAEHDKGRTVTPMAWSGYDNGYVAHIMATWGEDERGRGPVGMSIRSGRTSFIQDFINDAQTGPWKELARKNGYRSVISVPLLDAGTAFGALSIYSDQVNGFTEDEVELLEEMTNDLAFGIIGLRAMQSRAKAEKALRKSEEQYSKLMATIPDYVVVTDMSGNIVMVNEPTLRQSGYTLEEVVGRNLFMFMVPEDREKAINNAKMRIEGNFDLVEYRLIMKDGNIVLLEANGDVLRDGDGKPSGLVFVGRDVTKPRQLEHKLKEANRKLRVLDSITRHDVNNKLMLLSGNLVLLADHLPTPASAAYLTKAEAAVKSISAMIQFTKEYEKVGASSPIWQDIQSLVDSSAKGVDLGRVKIVNEIPKGAELFADPMITKVFYNLIDNAVRHGGDLNKVHFHIEDRGGSQVIICEDDGAGILSDRKGKLFSVNHVTDHGLGLFLSHEILGITEIAIMEEGDPGKGARFVLRPPSSGFRMI